MTSISILQYIITILEKNSNLTNILKKQIFVQIAEENTTFPFLVLKRDNIIPTYVKKNAVEDSVDISINIAALTYKQAIEIAEIVRKELETRVDEVIKQCRITSINEDYVDNAFIQILNFNIIL